MRKPIDYLADNYKSIGIPPEHMKTHSIKEKQIQNLITHTATTRALKDDGNLFNNFVFDPENSFYKVFSGIKVLSALATAYLYGYMMAFRNANGNGH